MLVKAFTALQSTELSALRCAEGAPTPRCLPQEFTKHKQEPKEHPGLVRPWRCLSIHNPPQL